MPGYTEEPWTRGTTIRGQILVFKERNAAGEFLDHGKVIADIAPTPEHPEEAEFNAQLISVAPLLDSALRAISCGDREILKRWMAAHCPERLRPDSENPHMDWCDRVVHVANYCISHACLIAVKGANRDQDIDHDHDQSPSPSSHLAAVRLQDDEGAQPGSERSPRAL